MQDEIAKVERGVPGVVLTRDSAELPDAIRNQLT
jgi:hypothetical protein